MRAYRIFGLAGAVLAAQQALPQTLERRLAAATAVECTFTVLATGTWEGADAAVSATEVTLEARFVEINVDEGTAEAGGDFGNSFISVRYAQGYLHFLQMSNAGPLRVTTVLAQQSANGRMKAVQTRHEYLPTILPGFTSRPEMYVGDCAVT